MFCPECGTQNPTGSKYCSNCAKQLPMEGTGGGGAPNYGPQGTMVMPPGQPSTPPSPFPPPQEQNYGGYPYGSPPANYQQQQPYPSPYQQPSPSYSGATDKPSGKAIAALVLGI